MIVFLSPGGQTTTFGDTASDRLLVGTVDGVRSFSRTGDSWKPSGRCLTDKHISALAFDAATGLLFAGVYAGVYEGAPHPGEDDCPLYASPDMGEHWERRNHGIDHANLFTVAVQKIDGKARLYAGTEPGNLFISDDGGQLWEEIAALRTVPSLEKWRFPAPPHLGHVKHVAFHPTNPEVLYVSIEVGGLLKSTDGGKTWRQIEGMNDDVHRVLVSPSMPDKLLLSGLGGICVSRDGGSTWENLTTREFRIGYPDALLMHPRNEKLLFMAGAKTVPGRWGTTRTADPRIARSRDGGEHWEILTQDFPEQIRGNIEAMSMNVWQDGFAVFAGTTDGDVFYSDDEGVRWKKIVEGIPPVSKVGHFRNLQAA